MNNLQRLQARLSAEGWDAIIVPSTDEYLSEFAQPFARRLRWATGFSGSTGMAIILQGAAALFVDGRYRTQAQYESAAFGIEVRDVNAADRERWLAQHVRAEARLAINTRMHPYSEVDSLRQLSLRQGIDLIEIDRHPIDELWGSERPARSFSEVFDYPVEYAGATAVEKCQQLVLHLVDSCTDWHLLSDPEDVAWLLNVRTKDSLSPQMDGWHIVPIPLSRALVDSTGNVFWFVEGARLESGLRERLDRRITVCEPGQLELFLAESSIGKVLSTNLRRTPYRFAAIVKEVGTLRDDSVVARSRWIKHPTEIECAKKGHFKDGKAVIRFLAWLQRTVEERIVTELDAAQKLAELRQEVLGYLGPSMPLMSASGANGALAHYVPNERTNRKLNDHPIYWMDSGGQYFGCSTDNTVCFALGIPELRHIRAHTLIVKGFIALTRARFPEGTNSNQLDTLARQYLWSEGLDYAHGTGHGVGNFMNIHEGPHIRRDPDHPLVGPLEAGMIISNEPGYYVAGDFGIRIESHLATVPSTYAGFLEFETLSRLPIDPRLIDFSLLSANEKQWLAGYHQHVLDGYAGCFDEQTTGWLHGILDAYNSQIP
jgi:Xaa-Pro aminopeptidase